MAPAVDSVAVAPASVVAGLLQGAPPVAQAVTVTVLALQARLLLASDSS